MRTTFPLRIRYHGAVYTAANLYHISSWDVLADVSVGDVFVLKPGPQGAEGPGVYFSEGKPRFTAAEGARAGISAVVVAPQPLHPKEWYRTKGSVVRKYGRPRTWHSKGRDVQCKVESIEYKNGIPYLHCSIKLL